MKSNNYLPIISIVALSVIAGPLLAKQENTQIKLCLVDKRNADAVHYVGTKPTGGRVQLQLLEMEGLKAEDYVLEVGCGALLSAIPIMSFLKPGHYVGIDPNTWLREKSLMIPENLEIAEMQRPLFLQNTEFDARDAGIVFDYVFAHSIMSHAADWQLPLFLENISKVLKEGGKLVFSIRLTEPNRYGNPGARQETHAQVWQYPGCSFFAEETVVAEAKKWFREVEHKKDYTRILVEDCVSVYHDWFVVTK